METAPRGQSWLEIHVRRFNDSYSGTQSQRVKQIVLDVEAAVLQLYTDVTGFQSRGFGKKLDGDHQGLFYLTHPLLGNLRTGGALRRVDVELFVRLANRIAPQHVFIVGNAWGYSTIVLSLIFSGAKVDVIDAGIEGVDSTFGMRLTRRVAANAQQNISILHGMSQTST